MSDSTKDLTAAQETPTGPLKTALFGGDLVGTNDAAIATGFERLSTDEQGRVDDDGTNYVGNPFEREGFLSPDLGYSR